MYLSRKLDAFGKFAIGVLAWNLVVILWGVFLRASRSGDGCGQHWLTCQGEVIPSAPELKTIIEYSHRITSFLAFAAVVALVVWTFRKFGKGAQIRKFAVGSLFFILTEALVGAGLVLTGNTAETLTPTRPFWMAGHLLNTFILLAFLSLTARYAAGGGPLSLGLGRKYLPAFGIGIGAIFVVGITGSIAALSNLIFPSGSLSEGIAKDFSETSNILIRLRLLHPITAILSSVFLIFLTSWMAKDSGRTGVTRMSNVISILIVAQIAFGSLTLFMLAPILLQLGHLLLADAIWIVYVLLGANLISLPEAASDTPATEYDGDNPEAAAEGRNA